MKYGELITFQPIESVIQLRDANRKSPPVNWSPHTSSPMKCASA